MAIIKLTRGLETIVDDEGFYKVGHLKWCAGEWMKGYPYAARSQSFSDGKRRTVLMHRFILDATKGAVVDHINGDTLDNRRANLRLCDFAGNARNAGKRRGCSSKYKGVNWHKGESKWYVRIMLDRKSISLGYYEDEIAAAVAYDAKAMELFGAFARPNFPPHQRAA